MARVTHRGFVVRADGDDRPVYLDDTGGPAHDPAHAKVFRTRTDAQAGLAIAQLAPLGRARNWRVEPVGQ
jgi:hypothetical protein